MPAPTPPAAHTAGTWVVENDPARIGQRWRITAPTLNPLRRYTVAVVCNYQPDDAPVAQCDARLMAASPELLAACRELAAGLVHSGRHFGLNDDEVAVLKRAEAAIAKATDTH